MKKTRYLFPVILVVLMGLNLNAQNPEISIVPKPVKMKIGKGHFRIDSSTGLFIAGKEEDLVQDALFLGSALRQAGGPMLNPIEQNRDNKGKPGIVLTLDHQGKIPPEGYILNISSKRVFIEGGSGAGVFYGIQTLLQLMPPDVLKSIKLKPGISWDIPCADIQDNPRFAYRGMHLDVSRHFFNKDFIKRYLDLMAMYKMNTFHWHLTDDNGWRIEIKKYPKLTQVAAWRVNRENLPWSERPPQKADERASYGGFYSQDDIREIVQYAKDRYITIIPEIEMPAHSIEVLAAYPQFSCTGGPFTVPPGSYWPNVDILCAGNDSVFTFLEDVLTEVISLFPSKYIHIGGDEADKTRWMSCPKCQKRIKDEGLKDEKELQSYFIKRIEKFIVSKGRKVIGWDEILEGGLPAEATVMSWRGVDGGIAAAKQGHDVIMTPTNYCYFDYYQGDSRSEPKAPGGYLPLKKVYSLEPVPRELNSEEQKHILGAQGNIWTEYIPISSRVEYMAIPRMLALSEVVWSPRDARNWSDFRKRLESQFKRMDVMNVNYGKGSNKVEISTFFDTKTQMLKMKLESEQPGATIRYTLNGNDPKEDSPVYSGPVDITRNCYIKASVFVDNKPRDGFAERAVVFHHAIGKKVEYLNPYSYRYSGGGDQALVDGIRATSDHSDGNWQGYLGNDMDIIIDLGKDQPIHSINSTFLQNADSWIFFPVQVTYSLSSDKKRFHSINEVLNDIPQKTDKPQIKMFTQAFPSTPARYIKVEAQNVGICPDWHEGKGEKCWMFVDEISVF